MPSNSVTVAGKITGPGSFFVGIQGATSSGVVQLNNTGKLEKPDAHFLTVLEAGQKVARATDGKFDASVQPLWELYADAQKRKRRLAGQHR